MNNTNDNATETTTTTTMTVRITGGQGRWGKDWNVSLLCPRGYTLHTFNCGSEEQARKDAELTFGNQVQVNA